MVCSPVKKIIIFFEMIMIHDDSSKQMSDFCFEFSFNHYKKFVKKIEKIFIR